jgi:glucose-1-phosphate thymidylyltransferase
VKVIIPLAGKGTRLRPHTYHTPKPLLKVGGRPVMSYILDDLRGMDVQELIFITGYLGDAIEEYIRAEYPDFNATFVAQAEQNGTAGAVKLAEPRVDQEVLIIFVDTIFDADLSIIEREADAAGILWAKEVEDYQRFGVIVTDEQGYMTRIVEKPRDPISKLANIGLYYVRDWRLFFEGVDQTLKGPSGPGHEYFITDAFQYMIDRGAKLKTVEVDGWYDCGKPDTLLDTNRHLLESGRGRRPDGGRNVRVHPPVRVEEGVRLENVELGPNVTIGSGSVLKDVRIEESIVGSDTRLESCTLRQALIGDRARLRGVQGTVSVAADSEVLGAGAADAAE